jgi:hypothetical protein
VLATFGVQALAIWMPQLKDKLEATAKLIESAAVGYGLLAAGDAGKSAGLQDVKDQVQQLTTAVKTGDTSFLKKQDAPTPPKP